MQKLSTREEHDHETGAGKNKYQDKRKCTIISTQIGQTEQTEAEGRGQEKKHTNILIKNIIVNTQTSYLNFSSITIVSVKVD